MLKKLAVAAGALVALAVVAFALLPHSYSVQREVIINASPETVFTYLTRLEERPKWLAWYQREPTGKASVAHNGGSKASVAHNGGSQASVTQNGGQTGYAAGLSAQPGTTFSWDGQEMGVGSATLTALTPNERLEFALSFKKPFTLDCNDTFVLEPVASGTKVVWTNHGGLEGPQRVMALFLDRLVGPDYAIGLANLKRRIEAGV